MLQKQVISGRIEIMILLLCAAEQVINGRIEIMTLLSHAAEFILLLVAADNHCAAYNSIIFCLMAAADFFIR